MLHFHDTFGHAEGTCPLPNRCQAGVEGAVVTTQNQSLPTRVPSRVSRSRRAVQIGVAGAVAVSASIIVPAALADDRGPNAELAAAVHQSTTSILPSTTTIAPATTTTTTVVEVPVAPAPPAPTPEELAQAQLAAMTPQERLAFQVYVMTDAERLAFAAYISPPPPPPPAPVVQEPVVTYVEVPVVEAPPVENGEVWDRLAQCEANGDWHINTGNGYSGGLQFHPGTWLAMGGGQYAPYAYLATREQQIAVGEQVLAAAGGRFTAWPGCRAKLGLP
jgi:hypothetical protein